MGGSALSSLSDTDLPPPPLPPPGETPGPSLERELSGAERKVTHRPHRRGRLEPPAPPNLVPSLADEVTPYGKLSCLPRGQASGSCSTTGSISSRGSTGSRGHGSGRSRTLGDRGVQRREGPRHGRC
uniref:Uncharacterized protein n=1 Tax=Calidris pygmaea TaxID=425635 RepID=A0A8C3K3W0_9CHAR